MNLRYASHLGYRSIETPLFRESVGSLDPVEHVRFAASSGFVGIQYALAHAQPREQQARVAAEAVRHGLEIGCVLCAPVEHPRRTIWGATDPTERATLLDYVRDGIETAKRVNSRWLAVLGAAHPDRPVAPQLAAFIENLRFAADMAERANVVFCLESLSRRSRANMLLHHIGDAYAMVKAVNSPAVRLIFDTAHVQSMDGDLLANLDVVWDAVSLIQLADNPNRLELGSGEINFTNVLRAIKTRGYQGLVELEHGWSEPTRACEQRGLARLREIDAQIG